MKTFGARSSSVVSSSLWQQRLSRSLGLGLLIALVIAPMAWMVLYALLYSLGMIGLFREGATLQHWSAAFSVGGLRQSLFFSLTIAALVTLFATTASLALTLIFPQSRQSPTWLATLGIPLATPAAVAGVMVYQLFSPGGLLARFAFHAGLITSPSEFPILVNDVWAIGILLAGTFSAFPLLTLFFLKTWTTAHIDRYCRLAESLGASRWQARLQVALPMLLSRGRSLILLTFLLSLGSYEIPLLLGRQSPQMFSVLTQRHFGQYNLLQRPQAFAMATTYLLLAGSGVILLLYWRRKRD